MGIAGSVVGGALDQLAAAVARREGRGAVARRGRKGADWHEQGRCFSVEVTVAETLAALVTDGYELSVEGSGPRAEMMAEAARGFVEHGLAEAVEVGFVTGDALVVPVWRGGGFVNAVVGQEDFRILSTDAGRLTGVAYLIDSRDERGVHRELYQVAQVMGYGTEDGQGEGRGVRYTLAQGVNGHLVQGDLPRDWAERYETEWWIPGAEALPVGRFRCPTRDVRDPGGVYGVPLCFGARQPIAEIHYLYDQMHAEVELKEPAVFADRGVFGRDKSGNVIMPRGRERLFQTIRGGTLDAGSITEWAPTISVQPYIDAIEQCKREVERCVGVDAGIISRPDEGNYQNVDNVRKSMRNTQSFVNRARREADQMIRGVEAAWELLANWGGAPAGAYVMQSKWSDEYLQSFADQRDALVQGYAMGATDAVDYRTFALGESPEVAEARVAEIAAGRRVAVAE